MASCYNLSMLDFTLSKTRRSCAAAFLSGVDRDTERFGARWRGSVGTSKDARVVCRIEVTCTSATEHDRSLIIDIHAHFRVSLDCEESLLSEEGAGRGLREKLRR